MHYKITRLMAGQEGCINISCEEFKEVKDAESNLLIALFLEEKIDIVLENYAEFERGLLTQTLRGMLFTQHDWSSFMGTMNTVNRRLMNLLATCRLYLDHLVHDLTTMYGSSSEIVSKVKSELAEQHDSCLGYRVLEAIRNYLQHRGLPITQMVHSGTAVAGKDKQKIRHSVIPVLNVNRLREDSRFKRTVIEELEDVGQEVDIRPFVREYIVCIGEIHATVRNAIRDDVMKWDGVLQRICESYRNSRDTSLAGLAVVAEDEEGRLIESVYISDNLTNRRKSLTLKNQQLSHFGYSFVSGEVVPSDV